MLNRMIAKCPVRTSIKVVKLISSINNPMEGTANSKIGEDKMNNGRRKSKKKVQNINAGTCTPEDPNVDTNASSTCISSETADINKSERSFLQFPYIYSKNVDSEKSIEQFSEETIYWNKSNSASVSKVLNDTMPEKSKELLEKWKQRKIKELGFKGFLEYKSLLLSRGHSLHKSIREYLSGQSALNEIIIESQNEGHWESLQNVFPLIKAILLEKRVSHPLLRYHGIADCICELKGEFVLLDWKTSEKKKISMDKLYDTPLQVAAYVGATNFNDLLQGNTIQQGAVVVAYNCGSPADVFSFDPKYYWMAWLQRLAQYHTSTML